MTESFQSLSHFSRVWLFATPWTTAHQVPLSMGFSRQEYYSRWPCLPPGDLPDPGIKPHLLNLLHWQVGSLALVPPGKIVTKELIFTSSGPSFMNLLPESTVFWYFLSVSALYSPPKRPCSAVFLITLHLSRFANTSLVAQSVKNLPAVQETRVQSLSWEDPLEDGMATHSSILAWRIPWTEEFTVHRATWSQTRLSD